MSTTPPPGQPDPQQGGPPLQGDPRTQGQSPSQGYPPQQGFPQQGYPGGPGYPPGVPPQGYPQGPLPPQPPKQKHTLRNVLLVVLAFVMLGFAGCVALVVGGANELDKAVTEAEQKDREPGGPDNPLAITPGEPFEVSGFSYQAGWTVGRDAIGDVKIAKLRLENNRGSKDSALVEIKFWRGQEVLALADCTTEPVATGTTTRLSCLSTDKFPKQYDRITINDSF